MFEFCVAAVAATAAILRRMQVVRCRFIAAYRRSRRDCGNLEAEMAGGPIRERQAAAVAATAAILRRLSVHLST